MPSTRSKTAPRFSGEIDIPIEEFLKEYEELADGCGLTQHQKVETVIWYVSTSQRHIWTSLAGFAARDWSDLCRQLRKEYISPSTQGRYSKQKLVELANSSTELPMEEEADMINYHRDFNTLSKPLLEARRITEGERNAIFWHGFHPDNRRVLWERLIAKQPDKPNREAFDLQDVLQTAMAIFLGDDDFIFRSRPLEDTKPTARENEGRIMPREVHEGLPVTGTLQGATGTAAPPPSKIKSRTIKRLWTKINTSPQIGGTDTRRRTSKQEQFDSKTTVARKKIRSWTT